MTDKVNIIPVFDPPQLWLDPTDPKKVPTTLDLPEVDYLEFETKGYRHYYKRCKKCKALWHYRWAYGVMNALRDKCDCGEINLCPGGA
jgi:hypothetical protein